MSGGEMIVCELGAQKSFHDSLLLSGIVRVSAFVSKFADGKLSQ
jgi:hypothetical protein